MSRSRPRLFAAMTIVSIAATAALPFSVAAEATGVVRGRVAIAGRNGEAMDPARAVVWLEGGPTPAARPEPGRATVTTHKKRFSPEILVVTAGATVSFPNEDRIQHNVFSSSAGNVFDLGLYGIGPGRDAVLREPGIVRVYCNVHPQMAAFVVVTPTALAARVRADGTFEIGGAPAGRFELRAWDERGGIGGVAVEIRPGQAAEAVIQLDGSRFKKQPHLDKDGKPYSARDEAGYE